MNWIKLTRVFETHDEEEVFVNIDHVDWMRRDKIEGEGDEITHLVYMADEETPAGTLSVKETMEEIMSKLNQTDVGVRREPEKF